MRTLVIALPFVLMLCGACQRAPSTTPETPMAAPPAPAERAAPVQDAMEQDQGPVRDIASAPSYEYAPNLTERARRAFLPEPIARLDAASFGDEPESERAISSSEGASVSLFRARREGDLVKIVRAEHGETYSLTEAIYYRDGAPFFAQAIEDRDPAKFMEPDEEGYEQAKGARTRRIADYTLGDRDEVSALDNGRPARVGADEAPALRQRAKGYWQLMQLPEPSEDDPCAFSCAEQDQWPCVQYVCAQRPPRE